MKTEAWFVIALSLLIAAPAGAQSLRVVPERLRLESPVRRAPVFAVNNRTRQTFHVRKISAGPARGLSVSLTTYKESGRSRLVAYSRRTATRLSNLLRTGFKLGPGGMFTAKLTVTRGARISGTQKVKISYTMAKGRPGSVVIPVLQYKPAPRGSKPIRCQAGETCFIAIGDFGTGDDKQRQVGNTMRVFESRYKSQFAIGLGDNFYPTGVNLFNKGKKFKQWEEMYRGVKGTFYMSLGNHDYLGRARMQVNYTKQNCRKRWCKQRWNSGRWQLKHRYYKFRKGDAEFFAIDTPSIDPDPNGATFAMLKPGWGKQCMDWLKRSLQGSRAKWKVVFGHSPVFNYGDSHDDQLGAFRKRMLRVLTKHKVDLYFGGHEHDQQIINMNSWKDHRNLKNIHFIVTGTGGKTSGKSKSGPGTQYHGYALGFMWVRIKGNQLNIQVIESLPAAKGYYRVAAHGAYTGNYARTKDPSWTNRPGTARGGTVSVRRTVRYQILWNTNLTGRTIRSLRPPRRGHLGCQDACTKDRRCRAFTYQARTRRCYLKSSAGSRRRATGALSGTPR